MKNQEPQQYPPQSLEMSPLSPQPPGSLKPTRSLRSIIVFWFLVFSLAPLGFYTFYSSLQYERAINSELYRRLTAHKEEMETDLSELRADLQSRRDRYVGDQMLRYFLAESDLAGLRKVGSDWMKAEKAQGIVFYGRSGRLLASFRKDRKGNMRETTPPGSHGLVLSEENKAGLSESGEYLFVDSSVENQFSLVLLSRVQSSGGRLIGYLQQNIEVDQDLLARWKSKYKIEMAVVRSNGAVVVSSLPDLQLFKRGYFEPYTAKRENSRFEATLRGEPYSFLVSPAAWGKTDYFFVVGSSTREAAQILSAVQVAFWSVLLLTLFVVVILAFFASMIVTRPILELVEATRGIPEGDQPILIPRTSRTEIGLLTESFNSMSRAITRSRQELKDKIKELENANEEIKDTQSRLVHNSKMISLGQLVAGVAHELNNPIGFIYSNMSHLRDYADRLIRYAEGVERNPGSAEQLRKDLDLEFVKKDLPKLVKSCEDGARRTRDIVLGLRNFSRLEKTEFKPLDLVEAIESTLNLLQGELKNRIEVIRLIEGRPVIHCVPSQINQVLMNLFSNAVHAIKGPGRLWITLKGEGVGAERNLVIKIQDSGEGISPDKIEKIFDPFFSTKEVGQGTGLGLSITYSIVKSHGGDIQVLSEVGKGTEFTITLPYDGQSEMS